MPSSSSTNSSDDKRRRKPSSQRSRRVTKKRESRQRSGFGKSQLLLDDPFIGNNGDSNPFDSLVVVTHRSSASNVSVSSGLTMEDLWDFQAEAIQTISGQKINRSSSSSSSHGSQSSHRESPNNTAVATKNANLDQMMTCTPQKIQSVRGTPMTYNPTTNATIKMKNVLDITKKSELITTSFLTESTADLSDTEQIMDELEGWGSVREVPTPDRTESPPKIRITLDDFDIDHLSFLQDDAYNEDDDEEESCEDSEKWIVKHLEKNSSFLYWLQLTTELTEPQRLIQALQGNVTVRNATVYPAVFQELSLADRKALVEAICQIQNLQNLIVFQDCGNYFLEPLIKYQPPLRRLTLYKLDIAEEWRLSLLPLLLRKFPNLEELSIEKYKGTEGGKLLMVMTGVLPTLSCLKTLSLTPAKNVKISSTSSFCFFRALTNNTTIRTLSLQGSEESINQTCINELIKALQTNSTIEEIKLTGFWRSRDAFWKKFDPSSKDQVNYYLKLNQAKIRNLQLDVNASFVRLRSAMVSNKNNLDHIYYLLSNNPSMVRSMAKCG